MNDNAITIYIGTTIDTEIKVINDIIIDGLKWGNKEDLTVRWI